MEEIIGGALLGAIATALFPKQTEEVSKKFNDFFQPLAKAAVSGLYTVTSTTMETVAGTQEDFKGMWEEARDNAEAKHKAANHVKTSTVHATKAMKIEVEPETPKAGSRAKSANAAKSAAQAKVPGASSANNNAATAGHK
jgi:hypothetical protein